MQTIDPKRAVHPLRAKLTDADWTRIQTAMEREDVNAITDEELDAAHDVLYDAIAGKLQTHLATTVLH